MMDGEKGGAVQPLCRVWSLGNKVHIGKHLATFGFEPVSHPEPPDAFCTTDSAFLEGKKKRNIYFFLLMFPLLLSWARN